MSSTKTIPLHVAFKGGLIAESEGLSLDAIPETCLNGQAQNQCNRDWRGKPEWGRRRGGAYLTFPDLKALAACPRALDAFWVEGDETVSIGLLEQRLLRSSRRGAGRTSGHSIDDAPPTRRGVQWNKDAGSAEPGAYPKAEADPGRTS